MQKGIINEINFTKELDHKRVKEISCELREMILKLFNNIKLNDVIYCWQSEYCEKADIKIRINNEIKGISIKTGTYCSMHQESIKSLYPFFRRIGIEENIIKKFNNFMLGYVKGKKVDSKTYISYNIEEINKIKNSLNDYYIKINLILRFIFQGSEKQKYGCDAIIYGTPDKFFWATKDEILKYLINFNEKRDNVINFSALNIKCYDRNLRNDLSCKHKQNEVQVKWQMLEKDMQNIKKLRDYKIISQNFDNN